MSPAISLQTSPSQQKDTSGPPVVSGPRELTSMPPSSTSVQCQAQGSTHFPLRQQAPRAQQSAATSNQFTRAGYFSHINLFALAFPSWMNSLLKRFVKHLTTWDKATIIAAVAIVVGTVISYFALKLAIWTATKDYIEYCQGEQVCFSQTRWTSRCYCRLLTWNRVKANSRSKCAMSKGGHPRGTSTSLLPI